MKKLAMLYCEKVIEVPDGADEAALKEAGDAAAAELEKLGYTEAVCDSVDDVPADEVG